MNTEFYCHKKTAIIKNKLPSWDFLPEQYSPN